MPALITFMRQHFQHKVLEDLRIPLQEQQGQALQLLMHALDSPLDRTEIFKEALQVARRGLLLADMVLQVQLRNGGRRLPDNSGVPWSPVDSSAFPEQWRMQAVILQEASRPQRSPLCKLRKIMLWVSIFSFLADTTFMYGHVSLVAERVVEHASARYALQQVLVRSKAGYKLATAVPKVYLGMCRSELEEWARLMSLKAKREQWQEWHLHWHACADVIYCSARAALAVNGLVHCSSLQNQTILGQPPQPEIEERRQRLPRWKCFVLKLLTRAALLSFSRRARPPLVHLQPLRAELRKPLWQMSPSDFRLLTQRADHVLEAAEAVLQRQLRQAHQRYTQCSEAGRAFLFADDTFHATQALSEAMAAVQEILSLSREYPVLLRPNGLLKSDIEALQRTVHATSHVSLATGPGCMGLFRSAALCWIYLATGTGRDVSAVESWHQAEKALAETSDAFGAAVCAAQAR